ncbi:Chaoptin [Nymphon striatum]|nr:Chaoptin [Nymphon striatum]
MIGKRDVVRLFFFFWCDEEGGATQKLDIPVFTLGIILGCLSGQVRTRSVPYILCDNAKYFPCKCTTRAWKNPNYAAITCEDVPMDEVLKVITKTKANGTEEIHIVNSKGKLLEHITKDTFDGLTNAGNIKWLTLKNNGIKTIEEGALSQFTNIVYIYLNGNDLSELKANALTPQKLIIIDLDNNKFSQVPMEVVRKTSSGGMLNLRYNNIVNVSPAVIAETIKSGSNVNVYENNLRCDCAFKEIAKYTLVNPLWQQTFIDYKKAFDSVEHQAVVNALNAQNISPAYIRMLDQIFRLGTSNIKLHTNRNKIRLEKEETPNIILFRLLSAFKILTFGIIFGCILRQGKATSPSEGRLCIDKQYSPCKCGSRFLSATIEALKCEGIAIDAIPEILRKIKSRTDNKIYLSIANDEVTTLPRNFLGNTSVTELGLLFPHLKTVDENAFTGQDSSLVSLRFTECGSLSSFPSKSVSKLNKLLYLEFSNSKKTFENLTNDTFAGLTNAENIRQILLKNDSIKTIGEGALSQFTNSVYIYLDNNDLTELKTNALPSRKLDLIHLDHNKFSEVPIELVGKLARDGTLNLRYNNISNVSSEVIAETIRSGAHVNVYVNRYGNKVHGKCQWPESLKGKQVYDLKVSDFPNYLAAFVIIDSGDSKRDAAEYDVP